MRGGGNPGEFMHGEGKSPEISLGFPLRMICVCTKVVFADMICACTILCGLLCLIDQYRYRGGSPPLNKKLCDTLHSLHC